MSASRLVLAPFSCFFAVAMVYSGFSIAFAEDNANPELSLKEKAELAKANPDNGLAKPMKLYNLTHCTAQLTPTLCELWGIAPPVGCIAAPIPEVVAQAKEKFGDQLLEKTLVFCPDAIGKVLQDKYPNDFAELAALTTFVSTSANVMPSVTPVNFSTIFTGTPPEVHGRTFYNKDLQKTPSLFDAFAMAGKKVCILAQNEYSMDKIFRQRPIDYISTASYDDTIKIASLLIERCDYDLIIVYDGEYDTTMHRHGVNSEKSLAAMRNSLRRYAELVRQTDKIWEGKNRLTVFASDHGSHDVNGKGSHGTDLPDDCIVNHCYRIAK